MTTLPSKTLNDGHRIPAIGLGTYALQGVAGAASVTTAIESGYRLIDTALNYKNERAVGDGIRDSGVPRSELFVTSKLPGRFHGFEEALEGFEESRANLGLDYLDLYLIHWPMPRLDKYVDTWRALVRLREQGLVRSIGVSNFTQAHLTRLIEETGVSPAVNQVELHPRFTQAALRGFHAAHGILTQSWTPLARQNPVFDTAPVLSAARSHGVTPAQAVLRWHVQLGSVPIPKSTNPARQRENLDVFGFELTEAEVASISSLESGRLWGADPETHEEL
jgi:diketogulonate reductase-like aldo/keto reductase